MGIEEFRIQKKDKYIAADVACPHCGCTFRKQSAYHCPECQVKIFDKDGDGWVILIDPDTADKSRKYKVIESSGEESEHYPGELVSVSAPLITDCDISITADGIELSLLRESDMLTARFLMPPHDVKVEKSVINRMAAHQMMNGISGMKKY